MKTSVAVIIACAALLLGAILANIHHDRVDHRESVIHDQQMIDSVSEANDSINSVVDSLQADVDSMLAAVDRLTARSNQIKIKYKYVYTQREQIADSCLLDSFNAVVDRYEPRPGFE